VLRVVQCVVMLSVVASLSQHFVSYSLSKLINLPLNQGILTEGEGSVQLTSLYKLVALDMLLFILKLYFSYLQKIYVLMRRSTVRILPLQWGFLVSTLVLQYHFRTQQTIHLLWKLVKWVGLGEGTLCITSSLFLYIRVFLRKNGDSDPVVQTFLLS